MHWYTLLHLYWPFPDMQVNDTKYYYGGRRSCMRRTNLTHLNWISNLPVWRIHTMITGGRDVVEFLHDALAPKSNQSDSDELNQSINEIFTTVSLWYDSLSRLGDYGATDESKILALAKVLKIRILVFNCSLARGRTINANALTIPDIERHKENDPNEISPTTFISRDLH